MYFSRLVTALTLFFLLMGAKAQVTSDKPIQISVQWDKPETTLRTSPTLQVVVMPPLEQGSPVHDASFAAVKELGADYVRYVPWFPYPRFAVAELEVAEGRQDLLGFLTHRPDDARLPESYGRPFVHPELQHHSCLVFQDREARRGPR